VWSGDLDAYAELVHRHAPMAKRTAVLLGAGADADDVVQEALVKAYRSLGGYRPGAPFRPWLLRIVANEARNHHRSTVRRAAREAATALPGAELLEPGALVADRERKEQLLAAVSGLPEKLRLVVTCRYLLDLDEAETADILAVPRGTVKSRLSRGLSRLRDQLAPGATDGKEADRV
jgi:RNA polymerase sigma-70 factor (ECF subfamily)